MAFSDINQFATEFAIRTQLNYYNLLRQETTEPEKIAEIGEKVAALHTIMREKGYVDIEFCCGTQLMNSVLGLLVFPEQQLYQEISQYYNQEKWAFDFPTLSRYVFSDDPACFESTYTYFDNRRGATLPERITPRNVLKHMRNAVSHKKISLFPVQADGDGGINQVTHIVFKDSSDDHPDPHFFLKIRRDDFESVMLEISSYFINIDSVRERDARR